jgi:hypothetical protein
VNAKNFVADLQRLAPAAVAAKIAPSPTYGDLRFNPSWDSLRGDPRFEKMVASLAPKSAM